MTPPRPRAVRVPTTKAPASNEAPDLEPLAMPAARQAQARRLRRQGRSC